MDTVADLLLDRAGDGHPGLRFEDATWSWAQVVAESAARGRMATALGGAAAHAGILLDNTPEHLFWIAGAALAGRTVVGINPTRRGAELARDIRHTDCRAIVTDAEHLELLAGIDHGVPAERILLVDSPSYADAVEAVRSQGAPEAAPAPGDVLLLLFTSGSTGAPKAVVCSQGRLARTASTAAQLLGLTRDDVCYQSMPLFHGNALMACWAPALRVGATVALRRRFSASAFLPDVRRFGATYFNYVGRALAYVLATPPTPHDADNRLRLGFGTEASAPDRRRFSQRFGCELVETYGSSEGVISMSPSPDAPEGSLGRPRPGLDVVVVDPVTGRECPPARFDDDGRLCNAAEAIGELVERSGAQGFEGYYGNPKATAARLRNGWYHSGDLAYRDAGGWYYFAGREADWLRVDSENFAAAPIERILVRMPQVVMAGVFGVPDPVTGDAVMAVLELAEGARFDPAAFGIFLADQADLGTKWAPRFVRMVDAMPLTATNKIDKQPLRREAWRTDDPVWWRPEPDGDYVPLDDEATAALEAELARHGRAHLVGAVPQARSAVPPEAE